MTIKQMEYFMAVARTLNYSEAAKILFISQPALSRSIAALEKEIGVPLFTRDKHNVRLTAAGVVLFNSLPRLGADLSRSVIEAQRAEQGQRGKLVLGILDGLPLLPPLEHAIQSFHADRKDLNLEPICVSMEEGVDAIHNAEIDLLFSYDVNSAIDQVMDVLELQQDRFAAAVSEKSEYAGWEQAHLQDFRRATILYAGTQASFELHRWKETCALYGFMPQFTAVPNTSTVEFNVAHDLGIALLPSRHRMLTGQGIRGIPLIEHIPLTYNLKWNRENPNPCIPMFLAEVRNAVAEE